MKRLTAQSRLGDYFVAFGLATRNQIKTALKSLTAGQMLGQALVAGKIVDRSVCERVAHVQKLHRKTAARLNSGLDNHDVDTVLTEKSFIGDILVALGSITRAEKNEWLEFQENERARGKDPGRLGELLVDNGVCSADERDLAMQVQNWLRGV